MAKRDQQLNREQSKFGKVVDILLWVIIVALLAAVLVRVFVFTRITVSGESMLQTFQDGEVVGVNKLAKPNRGDVVIFYKNDDVSKFLDIFASRKSGDDGEHTKLIKRVVAIAGDLLWVERTDEELDLYRVVVLTPENETLHENYYLKDGQVLAEETFFISGALLTGSDLGILGEHVGEQNALQIDDGCMFVMGDNRNNSSDSRSFGVVPQSRLFGVVIGA